MATPLSTYDQKRLLSSFNLWVIHSFPKKKLRRLDHKKQFLGLGSFLDLWMRLRRFKFQKAGLWVICQSNSNVSTNNSSNFQPLVHQRLCLLVWMPAFWDYFADFSPLVTMDVWPIYCAQKIGHGPIETESSLVVSATLWVCCSRSNIQGLYYHSRICWPAGE